MDTEAPDALPTSAADDVRAAIAELSQEREPEAAREGPPRDETGRFASKAEPQIEAPEQENSAEQSSRVETSAPERRSAPDGWPADGKVQWDKLPRALQDALAADLEAGKFRLGTAPLDIKPDPIREAVRDFEGDAHAAGADPASYVRNTLSWSRYVAANPEQGLRKLGEQLGVSHIFAAQSADQGQGTGVTVDPNLSRLERDFSAFRREVEQREHGRIMSAAEAEVNAWANEKAPDGSAARPHYAALNQPAFAARISLIKQLEPSLSNREVLQRAYDEEVYAQPATRKLILDAERQALESRVAAERARARDVSVRPSRSALAETPEKDSGPETAEQTVRRVMAEARNA